MNSLTLSSTVTTTSDAMSSALAGEEVILNLIDGTYYGLNETGTALWRRLATPCQVDDLCADLAAQYDVEDEAALTRDVLALLTKMQERGLVRVVRS